MSKQSGAAATKHIFVLGYDEKHEQDVEQTFAPDRFEVHGLLRSEELINQDSFDIEAMLDRARAILDRAEQIDGLVCHWDFPVTSMHSILCEEYNQRGPSLLSLLKCEHKYWSRLEQRKIVPENTPQFCAVDPFDDQAFEKITLDFPFWLKPVKGYGSVLGFCVRNREDFDKAIEETRKHIGSLGDPFSHVLKRVDMPPEIEALGGNAMIAEQFVRGQEFAPEGYVQNGRCHIHGLVDMVIGPNGKSFERYEYPSTAPREVQDRAISVSKTVMEHMEFDNGCFNIEFFWDQDTDDLWIVEINPRISQSHSYLFEQVNGLSNHEVAIGIALGEHPHFGAKRGPYRHAAKFLHRRYDRENLVAERVPEQADINAFKHIQPDTEVYPRLEKGMQLSEMKEQDPYSYVIADILIAAQSRDELEAKYRVAAEHLPFEFRPLQDARPSTGG